MCILPQNNLRTIKIEVYVVRRKDNYFCKKAVAQRKCSCGKRDYIYVEESSFK